jgi:23S rRNA (cytosine1962-C5)-methyltransferase
VSQLEPGSVHELCDSRGEFLGMVYANPASLITARMLSRRKRPIDLDFCLERIQAAAERRNRLFPNREIYRLVYGEGDLMPGLIVDKYGPLLVVQSLTAGMDRLQDDVVQALVEIMKPEGIFLRNDSSFRALEGLSLEKTVAYGTVPDPLIVASHGLRFQLDVPNGQKTGFYLDQECNRPVLSQYVFPGASVLDLFCYTAAWGLHAAAAGAEMITAVDSSRSALDLAASNAELNNMKDRFTFVRDSALDFLKKTHDQWDVVILDPPAFIKSRAQVKEGQKGYIDLNRRALGKIKPGGILVTCSCSHHLEAQVFEEVLQSASKQSGKDLRLLDVRGQGPDHPVLLSMPETRYLKVIVAQLV